MTERIMLDIESLATTPDAAIVSIGAVTFDTAPDPIGEELHISVSKASCREHGRRVDADTLDWWREQPQEARHILQGGRTLGAALAERAKVPRQLSESVRDACERALDGEVPEQAELGEVDG